MTGAQWLDVIGLTLVFLGACLSLIAGIGLLRLPDMLSRLHAQAKPQSTGLLFMMVGLGLHHFDVQVWLLILTAIALQFLTTPMAGIMLARSGYRSSQYDESRLYVDELAAAVDRADRANDADERRQAERERAENASRPDLDVEIDASTDAVSDRPAAEPPSHFGPAPEHDGK